MADFSGQYDPWTPGPPPEGMVPNQGIVQQIGTLMDDPRARSALLNFGLSLMQPPSFGDNPTAQIGRAIGSGGEAAQRVDLQRQKEEELASKQDLRGAQADSAVSRAQAAEARAGQGAARLDTAAANLELRRTGLDNMQERNRLGNRIRLANMYQKYVEGVNEKNNDPLRPRGAAPDPVLPMDQWIKGNPALRQLGLLDETPQPEGGDPSLPATPARPAAPSNVPIPSVATSPSGPGGVYPPAPANPAERQINKAYTGANGKVGVWMGNGQWLLQ